MRAPYGTGDEGTLVKRIEGVNSLFYSIQNPPFHIIRWGLRAIKVAVLGELTCQVETNNQWLQPRSAACLFSSLPPYLSYFLVRSHPFSLPHHDCLYTIFLIYKMYLLFFLVLSAPERCEGAEVFKNKVENPHNGPSAILVKRVTGNNGINW